MTIKQYMVDAFAQEVFKGNQAAICVTDEPLDDQLMQSIAILEMQDGSAGSSRQGGFLT